MTTAVIPCGGRGTRLAALAPGTPKELLPVAGRPLLQWTLDECAAAGLVRVVVVTSSGKPQIGEFLSARPPDRLSAVLALQPAPRGLGDAITCARAAAGRGDVAVLLPDNLFAGAAPSLPAIAAVLEARRRTGCAAVLLAEIAAADAATKGATGRVRYHARPEPGPDRTAPLLQIDAVAPKGPRGARFDTGGSPAALTPVGRMVFGPDVFDRLERLRTRLAAGAELDDVPLLQELAAAGGLVGCRYPGTFFDVGVPEGYRQALAALP